MHTLNVGFRTESFGPFSHLFEQIARQNYGLDLHPAPKSGPGEARDDSMLRRELDFVLGNHYSPLGAKAKGINLRWLAVPMFELEFKLITRREFDNPDDLAGGMVIDNAVAERCDASAGT